MEFITHKELAEFEQVPFNEMEKSNFHYSFSILPKEERNAINSVYAFCSYIDNIVDTLPSDDEKIITIKKNRLNLWEKVIEEIYSDKTKHKILIPFAKAIERFNIPKQYFLILIDGCRRDLFQKRYATFEELKQYCYSVASVVGLITIEIFGHQYEETKNYAINLGYALQLTNILRDIKSDKERGYIYLPQEDLKRFNYSESDLINEVYNENFIELMRFEVKRTRELYHKARSLLHPDERPNLIAAEIMDEIYYRILEKIELKNYDVFNKRIKVSNIHKLMFALKHWLSVKMFVKTIKKSNYD